MWSHVILVSQTTALLIENRLLLYIDLTKQKHYLCVNVVSSIFSRYMTDYAIVCVRSYL